MKPQRVDVMSFQQQRKEVKRGDGQYFSGEKRLFWWCCEHLIFKDDNDDDAGGGGQRAVVSLYVGFLGFLPVRQRQPSSERVFLGMQLIDIEQPTLIQRLKRR